MDVCLSDVDLEGRVGGRDALVKVRTDNGNLLVNVSLQTGDGVSKEQNTGTSSSTPKTKSRGPKENIVNTTDHNFCCPPRDIR